LSKWHAVQGNFRSDFQRVRRDRVAVSGGCRLGPEWEDEGSYESEYEFLEYEFLEIYETLIFEWKARGVTDRGVG